MGVMDNPRPICCSDTGESDVVCYLDGLIILVILARILCEHISTDG